jgi:hypothetical protein
LGDFHVKKIILPSGKAVEIVYFDAVGASEQVARTLTDGLGARVPEPEPQVRLESCPCCSGELVYPVDWRESESDRWELELRCPSCEWGHRDVYEQDVVERFDDILNTATDRLIDTLERVSRDNMREDIERFVRALEGDHILPFDF